MKKHLLYLLCPLFIAAANAQESADTQALRDYARAMDEPVPESGGIFGRKKK